jgi:DNA-binding MarR family transcriptional regulator
VDSLERDPTKWPGSARSVVNQIATAGPLTNKDLVECTGLARRTLGRTLQRLLEAGFVERKPSLRDTRRFYYFLGEQTPIPQN